MSRHNVAMDSLWRVMGGDMSEFVKDEAKFLGKTIVNFVPPLKVKGRTAKTAGDMAIDAENHNLFSEATTHLIDRVGSEHGLHNINTFTNGPDGETNLQWANLDPTGAQMDKYHRQYQNRRGKVPFQKSGGPGVWKSRVVVPFGTLDPFIKKLQARVGRARASIAQGITQLGATFPNWITRHFGEVNSIAIFDASKLSDPVRPSITFGSRAPGIDRIAPRIQAAVTLRTRAMGRRAKLMLSGYAKDIAAGYRVSNKAAATKITEGVIVE